MVAGRERLPGVSDCGVRRAMRSTQRSFLAAIAHAMLVVCATNVQLFQLRARSSRLASTRTGVWTKPIPSGVYGLTEEQCVTRTRTPTLSLLHSTWSHTHARTCTHARTTRKWLITSTHEGIGQRRKSEADRHVRVADVQQDV